jgi:activator of HSP90 ATPase
MKTIRQTATIRGATPHDLYEALIDSKRHAKLTGAPAKIGRKVGAAWRAYGQELSGTQFVLIKDRRITQTWRSRDWPKAHHSRATISLARARGGRRITFRQSGVPDTQFRSVKQGWIDFYWKPLKKTFGG